MTSTLILVLGAGLIFAACALTLMALGAHGGGQRTVSRSVAAIQALDAAPQELREEQLERPFSERVLAPLGDRFVDLGRKLVRADTATKIQYRLDVAGNPAGWNVSRILGLKALGLGVLGGLGFLYLLAIGQPLVRVLLLTVVLGAFGYLLPNVMLYNAGDKRSKLMRNALPDAIDLLTVSVEAGLGFDQAVTRVTQNTHGPLAMEFVRLQQEMQIGVGRRQAMAQRTSVPDLKSFCLAMVQADELGIAVGRVLRVQSQEMRVKRRQRAEEAAQQVPVKIMIPLVLFILPCLFIVVLGPAAISLMDMFSNM